MNNFKIIEQAPSGTKSNYPSLAEDAATCRGSHWALEFILASGQDTKIVDLISNVFYPKQSIGEQEFNILPPDKKWEMYERSNYIPYLDPTIISQFCKLLDNISENDIKSKYDPKELNDNAIYPKAWHNNNSPDYFFNERHILEVFVELKKLFKVADKENNYILVYIG